MDATSRRGTTGPPYLAASQPSTIGLGATQFSATDPIAAFRSDAGTVGTGPATRPVENAIEVTFEKKNPFLRAFDPDNGQLISRTELPSNAQGAPISYMADGKTVYRDSDRWGEPSC